MSNPSYEELKAEVERLRAKLSIGEDKDFTREVSLRMHPRHLTLTTLTNYGFVKGDKIIVRPSELWEISFPCDKEPSTRDLAKLGRSLQAMGWARSAKKGNLVFTISVEEYASQN